MKTKSNELTNVLAEVRRFAKSQSLATNIKTITASLLVLSEPDPIVEPGEPFHAAVCTLAAEVDIATDKARSMPTCELKREILAALIGVNRHIEMYQFSQRMAEDAGLDDLHLSFDGARTELIPRLERVGDLVLANVQTTPPPLEPHERSVLNLIQEATDKGETITGKVIIIAMAKDGWELSQSCLTSRIIPKLRSHYGVVNQGGYFVATRVAH